MVFLLNSAIIKYMNKTRAKKYLSSINSLKMKNVTAEKLSRKMGIYPEKIREELSFFEPMLMMDYSYNLKDLLELIDDYIKKLDEEASKNKVERVVVHKKEVNQYKSVTDFVYKNMTIGGLVDPSRQLNEVELRTLKKLIEEELEGNKKAKSRKRK